MTATRQADVTALSARARVDLVAAGQVEAAGAPLADGTRAGRGDTIVTRRNQRQLATNQGKDWVRNGDLWQVLNRHDDGALTVRHHNHQGTIRLPASYVADHVQLGYATTVHRAQGATVDTAHTLLDPTATRETAYVAMTRGRTANHAWVVTDELLDIEPERPPWPHRDAHQILAGVLNAQGNERAATDIAAAEARPADREALLARYREVLARIAGPTDHVAHAVLDPATATAVLNDHAWPALDHRLRHIAAQGGNPRAALRRAAGQGPLANTQAPAAVLHHRLGKPNARAPHVLPDVPRAGDSELISYARRLHRQIQGTNGWRDHQTTSNHSTSPSPSA